MQAIIKGNVRKDGKVKVAYGFNNGVWINKIVPLEQAKKDVAESEVVKGHDNPFNK